MEIKEWRNRNGEIEMEKRNGKPKVVLPEIKFKFQIIKRAK